MRVSFLSATLMLLSTSLAAAQESAAFPVESRTESFLVREIQDKLRSPWALAFLPGGDLLVTERPGTLLRLHADGKGGYLKRTVAGTPSVWAQGQGGLLDVAAHPDFSANGLVYLTFSRPGPGGAGTALGRGRLEGTELKDFRVLWELPRKTQAGVHFGSRIAFGPDGLLYFNVSDRGDMKRAQDSRDAAGSLLRLKPDGSIPESNPAGGKPDWLPELYSIGHRNIQGLAFDGSGRLWATEHGPMGGDELNLIRSGANFGWPAVTLGVNYDGNIISDLKSKIGMDDPKTSWTPSIAPSGLAWYPPGGPFRSWAGNLLSGNLAGQELRRIVLDGERVVSEETLLKGRIGRIRDVRVGPDGLIYLLTDSPSGSLYRLESTRQP